MRPGAVIALVLAAWLPAGCGALPGSRAEFAPPQDRWPSTLPSAILRGTPAPPVAIQYCYRTLAAAECFSAPQPGRTGFTGIYPIPGQY
ncbi:MAG: hypothetical protein JO267_05650 [Alphaproteobacteria bacterium]|nr:hypothetical protein [Alphaproteobacteria bacterium]